MPRLTGHLQPGRNWPTLTSSVLITHSILQIWPICLWTEKTIESRHFSYEAEVIATAETLLDGENSEFF